MVNVCHSLYTPVFAIFVSCCLFFETYLVLSFPQSPPCSDSGPCHLNLVWSSLLFSPALLGRLLCPLRSNSGPATPNCLCPSFSPWLTATSSSYPSPAITVCSCQDFRLDNRLYQQCRERASLQATSPQLQFWLTRSPAPPEAPDPTTAPEAEPEPMQVGRANLSPTKHLHRRRSGECLYCGGKGHFITLYPVRPKDQAPQ